MPKKIFNSDLETSGEVKATSVVADTVTISGGYISASTLTDGTATLSGGVFTANTLTDGTATLSGGVFTANTLTDGTATLSGGVFTANTLTDGTATLSGGVFTANTLTDGTATLSGGVFTANHVVVPLIEASPDTDLNLRSDDSVVITIDYDEDAVEAEDYPHYYVNLRTAPNTDVTLMDINQYYTNLNGNLDGNLFLNSGYSSLRSSGNVELGIDTGNNNSTEKFIVYRGTEASFDPGAVELLKVSSSETRISSDGITLESSAADITLKTGQNSLVKIEKETEDGSPVGLILEKPVQGAAYLTLTERHPTYPQRFYGGRLAYEGDYDHTAGTVNSDEDLGIGMTDPDAKDFIALQGLDNENVYNVLTYTRTGKGVKLESQASMNILAQQPNGTIDISSNGELSLVSLTKIQIRGNNLELTNIPADSSLTTTDSYYLGVTSQGRVYRKTSTATPGAYFFSGHHTYHSTEELPVGACVQLISGVLSLSTTPSSTVCCGIVNTSSVCSEETPFRTSLGEELSSGYVVTVISVGDSRHEDCQGFNVCNENGDIQPGDLLVTSNTAGYLMKQDDDIIRSCTVGKAMETVTFDESGKATGVYGYIYCG